MNKSDRLSSEQINNAAKVSVVQNDIIKKSANRLNELNHDLKNLSDLNKSHSDALDSLLKNAEAMLHGTPPVEQTFNYQFNKVEEKNYKKIEPLFTSDADSWNHFISHVDNYIETNNIHVHKDPFENLLSVREKAELTKKIHEDYHMATPNCDRYDYMIAVFCGVASGLIDSFFVGMPTDSRLGKWTDQQVDNVVLKFSKKVWRYDKKNGANLRKEPDRISSAIGYLERRFKVNYDARFMKDLNTNGETFNMTPSNHHLKSLGHSPDIIGLFFSILDQFTSNASFISDGKILRLEPIEGSNKFELRGTTFISKLFAGFSNWLGHLMSDIVGSSGTRGHEDGRRGAGIPLPFYELFQLCDFGSLKMGKESLTFAEFSTKVFESGYDARFGVTMAVPVLFNELSIRLLWAIKSKFYHKKSWKESIPIGNKPELRRMLVVGHGSLCLVDGVDAGIRSGGELLLFATHINIVAWSRFAFAALLEVRGIYRGDSIDIVAIDKNLKKEWERLFHEAI